MCKEYLAALDKFRSELYKFQGADEISLQQADPALHEKALGKRREIYLALTQTVQEINQTNVLLSRLTSMSGHETIETFNRLRYRGRENWGCRGGKVRFAGGTDADQILIQQAVETAVKLRCEEYINSSRAENGLPVNS